MSLTYKRWTASIVLIALATVGIVASLLTLFTDQDHTNVMTTFLILTLSAGVLFRTVGWLPSRRRQS